MIFPFKLASPEQIKQWSSGEIKNHQTLSQQTLKPVKDGLFCASIFGPRIDWECLCGKFQGEEHKGTVCAECKVEVTKHLKMNSSYEA